MTKLHLQACPPFRFDSVVRSHGWVQLLPFSYEPRQEALSYIIRLDTTQVTNLEITAEAATVNVATAEDLTADEASEVAGKVSWMLGLQQDFSTFYDLVREEPALTHVIDNARGRILRSATVFEDTVKMILTTNTSWAGTKRMVAGVVNSFGSPLGHDPTRRAFPTPAQLADAGTEALQKIGLGYRAPFIAQLARDVVEGGLDLEELKTGELSTPEIRKRLLAIKGVGAYASAGLLMLLGRYDAVPVDSYAKQMVSQAWHAGGPVTAKDVAAAFADWGAWRGLAYWFWDWSQAK